MFDALNVYRPAYLRQLVDACLPTLLDGQEFVVMLLLGLLRAGQHAAGKAVRPVPRGRVVLAGAHP